MNYGKYGNRQRNKLERECKLKKMRRYKEEWSRGKFLRDKSFKQYEKLKENEKLLK